MNGLRQFYFSKSEIYHFIALYFTQSVEMHASIFVWTLLIRRLQYDDTIVKPSHTIGIPGMLRNIFTVKIM